MVNAIKGVPLTLWTLMLD